MRPTPGVAVVGVGGAGVNAVTRLQDVGLEGVAFVAVDTSDQTLRRAADAVRVSLGRYTKGLGTGSDAALGEAAARAGAKDVAAALMGADLVFVAAGLAGGTGGGAGPVVAQAARSSGAVTVGFGETPFAFEAPRRAAAAEAARRRLAASCDATVILDNQRALELAGKAVSLDVALRVADDVLRQAVQGLSSLVTECGPINVDLAVVRDLLTKGGECCLALGVGRGPGAAHRGMVAALDSPLADMAALGRAPAVLAQVTGGEDLAVRDTAEAVDLLRSRLSADCRLVVGTGFDSTLAGACQVTVLATGLQRAPRTVVDFPADSSDWRRAAGLAGAKPRDHHEYAVTGQVIGGEGTGSGAAGPAPDLPVGPIRR